MKLCFRAAGPHRPHIWRAYGPHFILPTSRGGFRRPYLCHQRAFALISAKRLLTSGDLPRTQAVHFALPRSYTHEGLAYVACPACGKELHLHDMLLHLTSVHKGLDPAHCERICNERLVLYRRVIGAPLKTLKEEPKLVQSRVPQALQPTLTPSGAYLCNWCVFKLDPFPTRDAFIKHVLRDHPELDLGEVEDAIPLPVASPRENGPAKDASEELSKPSSENALKHALGRSSRVVWGAAALREEGHQPRSRAFGLPTRRLTGVGTTAAAVAAAPTPAETALPRQVGVNVPRGFSGRFGAVPVTVSTTAGILGCVVEETRFLCELCGKDFGSELDLLNHLEGRHPDGTIAGSTLEIAQYTKQEAASSYLPVYVRCDFCSPSKVYTSASALFAHIRLKHPLEDAAFQVERLIEAQKNEKLFVCAICYRAFTTQEGLDGHTSNKHKNSKATNGVKGGRLDGAGAGLLGPVTDKNRWWCATCERGFSQAKSLHGHMVNKHLLPTQSHPCPACKRIFSDVYSLEEHFSAQHKGVSLTDLGVETHAACPDCSRLFLNHEELHRHAVRHHRRDPRKPVRTFDASKAATLTNNASRPARQTTAAATVNAAIQSSDVQEDSPDPPAPRKISRKKKL